MVVARASGTLMASSLKQNKLRDKKLPKVELTRVPKVLLKTGVPTPPHLGEGHFRQNEGGRYSCLRQKQPHPQRPGVIPTQPSPTKRCHPRHPPYNTCHPCGAHWVTDSRGDPPPPADPWVTVRRGGPPPRGALLKSKMYFASKSTPSPSQKLSRPPF